MRLFRDNVLLEKIVSAADHFYFACTDALLYDVRYRQRLVMTPTAAGHATCPDLLRHIMHRPLLDSSERVR